MSNGISSVAALDVKRAWEKSRKSLAATTPAQRTQTLVKSGVLTKSGNVAGPYKGVIKAAKVARAN